MQNKTNTTVLSILESLKNKMSIWEALYALFSYLAAGINWHTADVYDGVINIVIFAYTLTVSKRCGNFMSFDVKKCKKGRCSSDIMYVLKQLENVCVFLRVEAYPATISDIYIAVIENWDKLADWSITYRLLAGLVKVCRPKVGKSAKQALIRLLGFIAKSNDLGDKTNE